MSKKQLELELLLLTSYVRATKNLLDALTTRVGTLEKTMFGKAEPFLPHNYRNPEYRGGKCP